MEYYLKIYPNIKAKLTEYKISNHILRAVHIKTVLFVPNKIPFYFFYFLHLCFHVLFHMFTQTSFYDS